LCGDLDILKLAKYPLIYTALSIVFFIFQFVGAWSFLWGAKPKKSIPYGDGTG